MSRSQHFATEALTSIKLVLPNFYTALPDAGVGAAATVTASIEYPSGTIHKQITFNTGAPSVSIPNISTAFSDYMTVSIPNGATFWVRVYYTNPNGIVYQSEQMLGASEQFAAAVSGLADQTMTGAAISGGTSQTWVLPPLAIIGRTVNRSVLVIGDSRTTYNGNNSIGIIAPSLNNANVPFVCIAYFSARAYQWLAHATARDVLLPYGSQVINALGINDLFDAQTPAQLVASLQSINAATGAKYKYNTTLQPYTSDPGTPAAAYTTLGQQSVVAITSAFNDLVRAGFAGQSGFYEIADTSTSAHNSNKWIVTPTPPYTGDGLHPNNAGIALITNSGVIIPAPYP